MHATINEISKRFSELQPFQLVIAAVDNGHPAQFEALRVISVILVDDEDNAPIFQLSTHTFTVPENLPAGIIIGIYSIDFFTVPVLY